MKYVLNYEKEEDETKYALYVDGWQKAWGHFNELVFSGDTEKIEVYTLWSNGQPYSDKPVLTYNARG